MGKKTRKNRSNSRSRSRKQLNPTKRNRKFGAARFFHYSYKPITDLRNISDANVGSIYLKPKGLWLSEDDSWQSFCSYADHCNLSKYRKYEATVDISKLYIVDTIDALNKLQRNYSKRDGMIDWAHFAKDYPGIYFTNYETVKNQVGYSTKMYWFLAVDLNSMCIWRPSEVITSFREITES